MYKKYITGAVLSILSITALADSPSFNYLDLGYANFKINDVGTINGYEIKGSYEFSHNWFVAADFTKISKNNSSLNYTTLGIGYKYDFGNKYAFYTEIDYAKYGQKNSPNLDGIEATVGLRSMLTDKLEVKVALEYIDIGASFDNKSFVFGGAYNFTDTFAAYVDYKHDSKVNRVSTGLRLSF